MESYPPFPGHRLSVGRATRSLPSISMLIYSESLLISAGDILHATPACKCHMNGAKGIGIET